MIKGSSAMFITEEPSYLFIKCNYTNRIITKSPSAFISTL